MIMNAMKQSSSHYEGYNMQKLSQKKILNAGKIIVNFKNKLISSLKNSKVIVLLCACSWDTQLNIVSPASLSHLA